MSDVKIARQNLKKCMQWMYAYRFRVERELEGKQLDSGEY